MNTIISTLPKKESNYIKNVIKSYDERNYKKALKQLEKTIKTFGIKDEYQILKNLLEISKDSNMPEPKAEELIKNTRRLLMKKLKSGFNWHCLAIMYKTRKNYKEAAKSMLQAVRFHGQDRIILRDAANLLLESRDLLQHRDMRRKQLESGSSIYGNWLGYAMSRDLIEDHDGALDILDSLMEMMMEEKKASEKKKKKEEKETSVLYRKEYSHLLVYKAKLLAKTGRVDDAISVIKDQYSGLIIDKTEANREVIQILLDSQNYHLLKPVLKRELKRNPFNLNFKLLQLVHFLALNGGKDMLDARFKQQVKENNVYKALIDLIQRFSDRKKELKKMRDYLVLSSGTFHTEVLDMVTLIIDIYILSSPSWMPALRILIRRNIASANFSLLKKLKPILNKKFISELVIDSNSNKNEEKLNISSEKDSELNSIKYSQSLAESLIRISNFINNFKKNNPVFVLLQILLQEINAIHTLQSWDKVGTTKITNTHKKMADKYKKHLSTILNLTNLTYACHCMGYVLAKLGYFGEAIILFNFCLNRIPTMSDSYFNRGKCFIRLGFIRQGLNDFEQFRRLNHQERCPTDMCFKFFSKFGAFDKCETQMNYFIKLDKEIPKIERIRDLQKVNYLWVMARGYKANGLLLRSTRFLNLIRTIFRNWRKDQLDYYSYALRQNKIGLLIDLLKSADKLEETQIFQKLIGKYLGNLIQLKRVIAKAKESDKNPEFEQEISNYRYKTELGIEKSNIELKYEELLQIEETKDSLNDSKNNNAFNYLCTSQTERTPITQKKFDERLRKVDVNGKEMISKLDVNGEAYLVAIDLLKGIFDNEKLDYSKNCYQILLEMKSENHRRIKNLSRCFKVFLEHKNVLPLIKSYTLLLKSDVSFINLSRRLNLFNFLLEFSGSCRKLTFQELYDKEFNNIFQSSFLKLDFSNLKDKTMAELLKDFIAVENDLFVEYMKSQSSNKILKNSTFASLFWKIHDNENEKKLTIIKFINFEAKLKKDYWVANLFDNTKDTLSISSSEAWIANIPSDSNLLIKNLSKKQLSRFIKLNFL